MDFQLYCTPLWEMHQPSHSPKTDLFEFWHCYYHFVVVIESVWLCSFSGSVSCMFMCKGNTSVSVQCLSCCVVFSTCTVQMLNTPIPGAAGSPATESEPECSTGQVEPAAGADTSRWKNNGSFWPCEHRIISECDTFLSTLARANVQKSACADGSYLLPHGADQLLILLPAVASFSLELEFQRLQLSGHGSLYLHCLQTNLTEDSILWFERGEKLDWTPRVAYKQKDELSHISNFFPEKGRLAHWQQLSWKSKTNPAPRLRLWEKDCQSDRQSKNNKRQKNKNPPTLSLLRSGIT